MSKGTAQKAPVIVVPNNPATQAHEDALQQQRIAEGLANIPTLRPNCFSDFDLEAHRASRFLKTSPPAYEWLIKDSLQKGRVGMVAAPGGIGKSYLLLQLAMSVASGTDFLNGIFPVLEKGRVMALFAEDDEGNIHRRVQSIAKHSLEIASSSELDFSAPTPYANEAGLVDDLIIPSIIGHDLRFFKKEKDNYVETPLYKSFLSACKEISGLSLIVIDPVSRFFSENENDNQAATYFISLLERIAEETGATVIAIHHIAKLSRNDTSIDKYLQQDAVRGASGFVNGVRWLLLLAPLSLADIKSIGGDPKRLGHYLAARVAKNNAASLRPHFLLERGPGGVLMPFVRVDEETKDIERQIVTIIRELEDAGERIAKTSFLNDFGKKKFLGMGKDHVRPILDKMIDAGELVTVEMPNKSNRSTHYIHTKEVAKKLEVAKQRELPK